MHVGTIDLDEMAQQGAVLARTPNELGVALKLGELQDSDLAANRELAEKLWETELAGPTEQKAKKALLAINGDLRAKKTVLLENLNELNRESLESVLKSDPRLIQDPEVLAQLNRRLAGGASPENTLGGTFGASYKGLHDSAGRPLDLTQ